MPATSGDDGSEDVNDFLLRIRELGDQRDKEDEERTRKLEEEIIQGRKERQARRAERARSLSPMKDAPSSADTPGSIRSGKNMSILEETSKTSSFHPQPPDTSSLNDAPRKANATPANTGIQEAYIAVSELAQPPSKPQTLSSTSTSAAMPLSGAGTLSWQQRPSSRGSIGPRTRPLSMLASDSNASRPRQEIADAAHPGHSTISWNQVAQSLGAKDPTWFMQTQDRGVGSAAYRKNQMDSSDKASMPGSMRLPGLSWESTVEAENRRSPPLEGVPSNSPYEGSSRDSSRQGLDHSASASVSSTGGVRSPLPAMESKRFAPPSSDTASSFGGDSSYIGRPLAMSPSQGRISPERMDRPVSPTKGLGGFVQSAMMKRSDSVSKRWSAQAGPGLSRRDSVASNTSGYGTLWYPRGGITPLAESSPNSISCENSPAINSRPGSSHSNATVTRGLDEFERPGSSTSLTSSKPEPTLEDKPPNLDREEKPSLPPNDTMSPPASPSKRWSPSKASWLENAINKPDSPKFKMPVPQQPAWMADIARAKQQRGSVDLSKGNNFKEVTIGGLVRPPPSGAGYKPPTISGLPSGFSAGLVTKPRMGISDDTSQRNVTPEPEKKSAEPRTSSPSQIPSPGQSKKETGHAESQESEALKKSSAGEKTASGANSRVTSPTAAKAKPETPPKKDFKASLNPRSNGAEAKVKDESEFKNVFGKLKRTQTQNYVAPDEFKGNIMRGKAGLAQTGGPKKTEPKDDFKESILQKKQKMIAPSASTRITSTSLKVPDHTTPEAIAKRNVLTKSESLMSNGSADSEIQTKPEAFAKLQHLRDKPKTTLPENLPGTSAALNKDSGLKAALGGNFTSSLAGMLQRGPSPMTAKPSSTPALDDIAEKASMPTANTEPSSAGPQLTHATKARAKGPKRRLPTASKQSECTENKSTVEATPSKQSLDENQSISGSSVTKLQQFPSTPSKSESRPLSNITNNNNNNNRKVSQLNSPRKSSTSISLTEGFKPVSPVLRSPSRDISTKSPPVVKQKPSTSPKVAKRSNAVGTTHEALPETPSRRQNMQEPRPSVPQSASELSERDNGPPEPENSMPSVKGAVALWGQSQKPTQPSQPESPVKLPTREDKDAALEEAGLKRRQAVGLGIKTSASDLDSRQDRKATSPAPQSPKSPPSPGKKPASTTGRATSTTHSPTKNTQASRSTLSQPLEVSEFFANIFDEAPSSKSNTIVDRQTAVNSRASEESSQKIKTLRKQIFEVTSNGKSVPVPSHQEHILFEESLYLCTHVFGSASGQRTTEVYLWCGDGVSSASVEDAQLFAKKVAKDSNGKLIVFRQGKESTNFFQALGGIVITRRGSGRRATSSTSSGARYILCGRQHVGQIAFDEVDFTPRSLCRGFPYVVSTPSGKLYLWKGSGSGADELGCARLIGMDLGLTGDIEEIDEGREPDPFWKNFAEGKPQTGNSKASNAQHWHLKPFCENYSTRLFAIDSEAPRPKSNTGFMSWGRRGSAPSNGPNAAGTTQIRDIMPFAQYDLVDDGVFVLDAFFEVFIIFTIRSLSPAPQHKSTKSATFRAALVFAQEYGILAASAEDRPFVPVSSVVVCSRNRSENGKEAENIPEGLQRAFRKWDSNVIGECKVLPLTEALEATG